MLSTNNEKEPIKNEIDLHLSEHKYNLYQQFFIAGIDPKLMFNINRIELKTIPEPYIFPKIISKFPPNDLYYLNIPDTIIASHCFPNGILDTIIEYNESNYEEIIRYQVNFVFSLENQYPEDKTSSLRTNRVYYSCLLFYENIENYTECIDYKKKLYKENNNNNNELYNGFNEAKNKGLLIPKVICLSSFKPFFEESHKILVSLKKYVDNYMYNKVSKDNFNIYPIEKIIEGLIYNLPALPRSNFSLKINKETFEPTSLENKKNIIIKNGKKNDDMKTNDEIIFYETPFNSQPKNVINYSMLMKYFRIKEIFEIIKFILLEEPILFFCEDMHILTYVIEGLISLIYPFEYQYPIMSVLPEENYSFISIFKHFIFGINYKYHDEIFQKRGIILDDKKYIIIVKIEKRFETILNSEEEDKLKYSVITSILSDSSKPFLKIEQNKINDYEELYDNENINEKRKIMLPLHYLEKCTKRLEKNTAEKLREFSNKNKNKKNINYREKENIFNDEIRKSFIYFFSCILLRYQAFCIEFEKHIEVLGLNERNGSNIYLNTSLITNTKLNSSSEKDFDFFLERKVELEEKFLLNKLKIKDMFKCKNFIDDTDTPKLDRPFYKYFFETQSFFHFIRKKIFPNSLQDKLDILYFDYKINEKLSRGSRKIKIEIKFFNENLDNLSSEINIKSFKKEPSKKLIDFLNSNDKNCKRGINYFQIISKDPNKVYTDNKKNKNNKTDIPADNNETMDTGLCIISLHKAYDDEGSNSDDNNGSLNLNGKLMNGGNKDNIDDEIEINEKENEENDNKKKFIFSYFMFPKLLNDNLFFKENIFEEELENDKKWLNNKNNFNINNCNCLYNQFEKEANIFIKNPIIQENYKMFDYNLNAKWQYKYNYEECINKLWLLYLAKCLHCISISKKRYYFEEILMFLNDKKNKVDQDTILLLFNSINKYGDRSMNQEFVIFLDKINYINILCLREKTKMENNFVKYLNIRKKSNKVETNRGSVTNSGDIIDNTNVSNSNNIKKEDKISQNISRKLLYFYIYTYCSPISNSNNNNDIDLKEKKSIHLDLDKEKPDKNKEDNSCGEPLIFNIKDLFQYESNKKYIELQCQKCHKIQKVTIACNYTDDKNKKYQFNFNLISPLALLKEEWFKNNNTINTYNISKEYPEQYLSSLFYFYEQGLPCNFLLPKGFIEKQLKKELTNTYNNLEPLEDYLNARLLSHKKSINSMCINSPRFRKKDIVITERINIFDMKKEKVSIEGSGRKSPSPKKSSLAKRSKFAQLKNADLKDIKSKNVTFSLFKK